MWKLLEGDFQVLLSISSQLHWQRRMESKFLWYANFSLFWNKSVFSLCPTCTTSMCHVWQMQRDSSNHICFALEHNCVVPKDRLTCTCQAPKASKDSDSTCDFLSENWQFALAELNSSHYMAVCVEDDSSSGMYLKFFILQRNWLLRNSVRNWLLCCSVSNLLLAHVADSGNGRLPLGLKVWKTVPFLEDTHVSGTESVSLIS
jgi:hypothetical protein